MSAACWISSLNKLLDVDVGFWSLMCWQALVFAYWWQRHYICHQLHGNNWRQHFCHRLNRCCNKPGVLPLCLSPHFKIHGLCLFFFFLICRIRVQAILWAVSICLPQMPHQHPDIAGITVAGFILSQMPVAEGLCHSGFWVSWSAPICTSDSLKR